jgi:hypothetical protein
MDEEKEDEEKDNNFGIMDKEYHEEKLNSI